jgi:hypothetical protein
MGIAVVVIANDFSAINVALPTMGGIVTATTAGVTSVDESQTSLAGGIVYMFQIAGGSIGLALTTTVFSAQGSFVEGIQAAFRLDAGLSLAGFLVALFFVGGRLLRRPGAARSG